MVDVGGAARVRTLVHAEPVLDGAESMVGWLRRLCTAAVRALPAWGVGVSLLTEGGARGVAVASANAVERVEEMQFTAGEGPCLDAFVQRRPVLEPDLARAGGARWPAYARAAHGAGVVAVFAFPLQVGAARLGALDVYRTLPGPLSTKALAQALDFAGVALETLLDGQAIARPGEAADGLDEVLEHRAELYQAQGMAMVQLGVTLDAALSRLRAHAFLHDRQLAQVARDVLSGRLVLGEASG